MFGVRACQASRRIGISQAPILQLHDCMREDEARPEFRPILSLPLLGPSEHAEVALCGPELTPTFTFSPAQPDMTFQAIAGMLRVLSKCGWGLGGRCGPFCGTHLPFLPILIGYSLGLCNISFIYKLAEVLVL